MGKGKPLQILPTADFRRWVESRWPEVTYVNPLGFGLPWIFGDGSDGDIIISANTNLSNWSVMEYRNLAINATFTLSSSATQDAALIICVKERLRVAGTLSLNGKGGAGGAAESPGTSYATGYAGSGAGGGGSATLSNIGLGTGGSSIVAGGAGGGIGLAGGNGSTINTGQLARLRLGPSYRDNSLASIGPGGGGGKTGTSGVGGAGGNGGGLLIICAEETTIVSGGTISINGANGSSSTGDSGGGGAGPGGLLYIITRRYSNAGSITATAGTGGAGIGGGGAGGNGGAGTIIVETIP